MRFIDGAWLGVRVIIIRKATIDGSAVEGGGAVITKDVPPITVVVGMPARPIKQFSLETGEYIKVIKHG